MTEASRSERALFNPEDGEAYGNVEMQLLAIEQAIPAPGESSVLGSSTFTLPHGCFVQYRPRPMSAEQPKKIVDIQYIFVPEHLRGQQQEGAPSVGQRLLGSLRDHCIAEGVEEIDGAMTHPGGLLALLRTFENESVIMTDEQGKQLQTPEEALAYLEQGNVDVLTKVFL